MIAVARVLDSECISVRLFGMGGAVIACIGKETFVLRLRFKTRWVRGMVHIGGSFMDFGRSRKTSASHLGFTVLVGWAFAGGICFIYPIAILLRSLASEFFLFSSAFKCSCFSEFGSSLVAS